MITNNTSDRGQHIEDLRNALEHRATWFYYLVEEAQKRGLGLDFARDAIMNCGCFHGKTKYTQTDDLKKFAPEFITENVKNIFEMDVDVTDDELNIEFFKLSLRLLILCVSQPQSERSMFAGNEYDE